MKTLPVTQVQGQKKVISQREHHQYHRLRSRRPSQARKKTQPQPTEPSLRVFACPVVLGVCAHMCPHASRVWSQLHTGGRLKDFGVSCIPRLVSTHVACAWRSEGCWFPGFAVQTFFGRESRAYLWHQDIVQPGFTNPPPECFSVPLSFPDSSNTPHAHPHLLPMGGKRQHIHRTHTSGSKAQEE